MAATHTSRASWANRQRGFTLTELLVSVGITTIVLGATMTAMSNAIKATDTATMLTGLNNGLRTSMDLIVRDLLQVGQGLPSGNLILVPSAANAQAIRMPGPPTTTYFLSAQDSITTVAPVAPNGPTAISAVVPGPGRGPTIAGQPTDMITTISGDSAFDAIRLTSLAANGRSMVVWDGTLPAGWIGAAPGHSARITDGGADDVRAGDLIMLTRGSASALVQVTSVAGQTVNFAANDSLNLNQMAAGDGTVTELRTTPAADIAPAGSPTVLPVIATEATRIRMISYYLDTTTDPTRPRLVRRMNNGDFAVFNNLLGTAVAFDIENLQISYDLADGVTNPTNVRMVALDLAPAPSPGGRCAPNPCSPNQIRKVNIMLSGRSRMRMKGTNQFLRNRLLTQVSLRSLSFVDRYQ